MIINLRLTKNEADILLNWHSIQKRKYERYGSAEYIFPQEEWLLNNLKNQPEEKVFDEMDLEVFLDWMHKATQPLPGNNPIYFQDEDSLIIKLRKAEETLNPEESSPVESPSPRVVQYNAADKKDSQLKNLIIKIGLKLKYLLKDFKPRY